MTSSIYSIYIIDIKYNKFIKGHLKSNIHHANITAKSALHLFDSIVRPIMT